MPRRSWPVPSFVPELVDGAREKVQPRPKSRLVESGRLPLVRAMSSPKDTMPQDVRARRSAEALRQNLKRRKVQARARAAAVGARTGQDERVPKDTEKQGR
jgi:hypothetical protein